MTLLFTVSTIVLCVTTLLPLWRHPHWLVRSMDFPRMQLAIGATLLLIALVIWAGESRSIAWLLPGATFICLISQLWWILPYTLFWPLEVKASQNNDPKRKLKILTANVLAPNRQAGSLLKLVKQHQPDVLVTLESDQWWEKQLDSLESTMPYSIKCPLDNLYGMHVYSCLPLEDSTISYLVEDDIPSIHTQVVLRSGDKVRIHFLHPAPPSPTENTESAERDAELVIVARQVITCDQPVIVTGDLNDVAWSATTRLFRKLSGLLDPRVGRGMFNTFHANYPVLRWPLDHLFHSKHFTLDSINRLAPFGSDHFALLTELTFAPAHGANQTGLDVNHSDRSRARDIADEKNVSALDVPQPGKSDQ